MEMFGGALCFNEGSSSTVFARTHSPPPPLQKEESNVQGSGGAKADVKKERGEGVLSVACAAAGHGGDGEKMLPSVPCATVGHGGKEGEGLPSVACDAVGHAGEEGVVASPEGGVNKYKEGVFPSVACADVGQAEEAVTMLDAIESSSCATVRQSGEAAARLRAIGSSSSAYFAPRSRDNETGGCGGTNGGSDNSNIGEATGQGGSVESSSALRASSGRHSKRDGSFSDSSSRGQPTGRGAIDPSGALLVPSGGHSERGGSGSDDTSGGIVEGSLAYRSKEGAS